ncbi:hypothetical protein AAG570_007318 [Ranatra chinensis]|uniref:CDK-activating kinase assembly factor MAT1 n=1 Tax=Ranatra chinensis TaxID=642074 RepID=A0ABD0XWP5_9HEMI
MEDQVCPRCRTTKYRNPSLKLLVNVCGHSLCESCVELLFLKGSGSCPECQIPLRRSNFRVQLFEDPAVEKEVDIRKKVLRDYNKKQEDFSSLSAYNDYLEEIEDIIYNLVNGIDVLETNRRIEQYKRENREAILKNRVKIGRFESELDEMLEMEKAAEDKRREEVKREEAEAKRKRARAKEALIDELMFSEGNAKSIVESFATTQAVEESGRGEAADFSTGIRIGKTHDYYAGGAPLEELAPLYKYEPPEIETDGPRAPEWAEAPPGGPATVEHIRKETDEETAGGFRMAEACLRAIREAVAGLYYSSKEKSSQLQQPQQ